MNHYPETVQTIVSNLRLEIGQIAHRPRGLILIMVNKSTKTHTSHIDIKSNYKVYGNKGRRLT